jgi:DNA polymerase V
MGDFIGTFSVSCMDNLDRKSTGSRALGRSREEMPDPIAFTSLPSSTSALVSPGLDMNEYLIKHAAATFCFRMEGNAMLKAGVFSGDILVVDRTLTPLSGDIIVAIVEGDLIVRRLRIRSEHMLETDGYEKPLKVQGLGDFQVWGVVTYVIHETAKKDRE